MRNRSRAFSAVIGLTSVLLAGQAFACACGCGVFAVGTPSNFPTMSGDMVYVEYDFMNQNQNWFGDSKAPAANNDDKNIRTSFYTFGYQHVWDSGWGVSVEVPYWYRHFKTTDDNTGDIVSYDHANFGDVRIVGSYSGLFPDQNTGITFGVKLPSGDYGYPNFDRDTSIGTGSTDLILGVYHVDAIDAEGNWSWFSNAQVELPLLTNDGYRPGAELDADIGVSYNGWNVGDVRIAPVVQAVISYRQRDSGPQSDRPDSGYNRLLIAPGIEIDVQQFKVFANVGLPIYQNTNGNQLVAPELFKLNISYSF
jgi:hypothetical protein